MRKLTFITTFALAAAIAGCEARTEIRALLPAECGPGEQNTTQMLRNFEKEYPEYRVRSRFVGRLELRAATGSGTGFDVVAVGSACVPELATESLLAPFPAVPSDTMEVFAGHVRVFSHGGSLYALPWLYDAQCAFVQPIRWMMAGAGPVPDLWPQRPAGSVASLEHGKTEDWTWRIGLLSDTFGERPADMGDEPVVPIAMERPLDRSIGLALTPEAREGAVELVRYLCGTDVQTNFVRVVPPARVSLYDQPEVQTHLDPAVREIVTQTGSRLVRSPDCRPVTD